VLGLTFSASRGFHCSSGRYVFISQEAEIEYNHVHTTSMGDQCDINDTATRTSYGASIIMHYDGRYFRTVAISFGKVFHLDASILSIAKAPKNKFAATSAYLIEDKNRRS
jgi:hypothetical protein